tara:strand:+ start:12314 stop:13663 length:1350 start_codon:yes stop_codon:yes gene_type:complete
MKQYVNLSSELFSDGIFISYNNQEITFSDFYYNVSSKSRILTNLELLDNTRIGILLTNQIDIIELYFSCIQLKKIPIILPNDTTNEQLKIILDKHKIDFIITEWTRKKQIHDIDKVHFQYIQELSSSYGGCASIEFDDNIDDIKSVQSMHLTSGSTGAPKLISLTYENFKSSILQWQEQINFSKNDSYIQCLPINHIAGLSIYLRSQLIGFRTIVIDRFDSNRINYEIDNGANYISLVPSMVQRLINNRSGRPFPKSFKGMIIGGDSCSQNLLKDLISFNIPAYIVYGMTETCSGVCGFWLNDNIEMSGSVGKPFTQTKINIKNSHVVIEGPSITPLYSNGKKTKGIYKTCDIGFFKNKYLFIEGRTDDIIISGGENISKTQIKNILIKNEKIKEVSLEILKDDLIGDKIIAYVVVNNNLSEKDIINHCLKYLPKNKLPHEIIIVEEFL